MIRFLLSLFFICSTVNSIGQTYQINIQVFDSISNEPLPFANLYLLRSEIGTSTDYNGNAFFNLDYQLSKDFLVVSYVGYKTQKIAVELTNKSLTKVFMSPSVHFLKEVSVTYQKQLKPKQIIKRAIKNVALNYAAKDVILDCFYRETIKEGDKYIQLNEAFSKIYYTAYPQKKLDKKIWLSWDYDDSYAFEFEGDARFYELLHDFNTSRDKMTIVESRSSENLSKSGLEFALMGGPLGLTGYDKIKYQYDFLNPAVLNKYYFKLEGLAQMKGTTCYVIAFYPLPTKKNFVIDQSRKNKSAIYVGKIYIEVDSFAVVKFDYRLAIERDYGFFAGRVPLEYIIEVDYDKKELWYLSKVKSKELKKVWFKKTNETFVLEGSKELFVDNIQTDNISEFNDSSVFKYTKWSAVRYYRKVYNSEYWKNSNVETSFHLDSTITKDLEKETTLSVQFSNRFVEKKNLKPPLTMDIPYYFNYPGNQISDSLHWMAMPEYKDEFVSYLNEENDYAKNFLLQDRNYQRKIFNQIDSFYIKEEENSKHERKSGEFYYDYDSLGNYMRYRYIDSLKSEFVFNVSGFQNSRKSSRVINIIPNKDESMLLVRYSQLEYNSDFISVIPSGELTPIDSISNVYAVEWLTDSTLLYTKTNKFERSDKLIWHSVTTRTDSLILHEPDLTFDIDLKKDSEKIQCSIQSISENEIYIIDANDISPHLKLIKGRKENVKYQVKSNADEWYMLTNENELDNELFYSSVSFPFVWQKVELDVGDVFIENFVTSKNYMVVKVYDHSLMKVYYKQIKSKKWRRISFNNEINEVDLLSFKDNQDVFRYWLTGSGLPYKLIELNLSTGEEKLEYEQVLKNPADTAYIRSKRIWATGNDGAKIPITLIRSNNSIRKHNGLILKVYGAYGANINPVFSSEDAIWLKNGYTIAYAHVRGGSILGNDWYSQGKLLNKKNSFNDYIACANYLIKQKITSPQYLVAYGNSAGGLIVGWAINEYPELFNTAILDHPYLDVLNTMMIDTLPLTTNEYKEWGDPNVPDVFNYIKSYSPYQNIKKQAYPNLFFIAGYRDYRTPTWQVAKYVAAIRKNNLSDSNIIFITDMNSGHIGNTSGKAWIKSLSQVFSFVNINLFDKEVIDEEK
jgi:protease II